MFRISVPLTATLTLLTLACGQTNGGNSDGGSSQQNPSTGDGTSANTNPSTAARRYSTANICSLLSDEDAERVLQFPLIRPPTAKEETRIPQRPVSCSWTSSNTSGLGVKIAQLIVWEDHDSFNAPAFYDNARREAKENVDGFEFEAVDGLGEDAHIYGSVLLVKMKRSFFQVRAGDLSKPPRDDLLKMARLVLIRYRDE